jgi:hypothetical protein
VPTTCGENHISSSGAQTARRTVPHRFSIGEVVYLQAGVFTRNAAPGLYEVRGVLPQEDGLVKYRIKSPVELHERVAAENELNSASGTAG